MSLQRKFPAQLPAPGFTLIELLVALTVVAILSVIAWPGYAGIVHRAQRNDARLSLLRLQHLQERHYATHLRYAGALGTTSDARTLVTPDRSDAGLYTLTVSASEDGQRYTAIATANSAGRQRRDLGCQQLSIDQTGARRSADATGSWSESDPLRCWR
jgi:type IV pilus assembly protein PilE